MRHILQAGTAKVDITPPLTTPYLGYEPRHALFQGVHDPLYARALAVDDGETQAILVAADSIGYSNDILGPGRNFTAELRQRVLARTGVPAENIMLAASHAHSTPETINFRPLLDTPKGGPWLETLLDQLASAAAMAVKRRKPGTLRATTGKVEGLACNRRIIGGAVDHEVGVLVFETLEGDSCVVVANFACHAVTVQMQPLVSADFPGAAMDSVERTMPACEASLFLQGACGDQNPVGDDTRDFEDVKRYGLMLGGKVVELAARLRSTGVTACRPLIAVASETVSLPGRELSSREPVQAAYDEADRKLAAAATKGERKRFASERWAAEEHLIQIDRGNEPVSSEVQVARLGDVAIVGLPGEIFVEFGLEIKERSAAPHTFVAGYANDYLGYFATPAAWKQGGYEVGHGPWSRVGPAGGGLLVEKALDMIERLWDISR